MSEALPDASALDRAAAVMRDVRDRCVWTQQMTHEELVPYLVEESAEVIEAVETGTSTDLREELGDLLWQVLFHAEISARAGEFDIDDVAGDLADKMIRRHPHVFAGEVARTPEEVLVHWNAAKAAEKRERRSVLDGIPAAMPALPRAQKVLGRASSVRVGPPTPGAEPVDEEQLGDALLAMVARARQHGWDAERALRRSVRALEDRVRAAEATQARSSERS
ncbi:MazG family protein [Microbacterium gorillae]|uniref:MazG family protein n=1 Tax=Microbacterium gorillae TaxID=1231063 RepID=UPI003D9909F8